MTDVRGELSEIGFDLDTIHDMISGLVSFVPLSHSQNSISLLRVLHNKTYVGFHFKHFVSIISTFIKAISM